MAKNQNPYRSATVKELKKMIASLDDDSEINMEHSEQNGRPYSIQMSQFSVKDGMLYIQN